MLLQLLLICAAGCFGHAAVQPVSDASLPQQGSTLNNTEQITKPERPVTNVTETLSGNSTGNRSAQSSGEKKNDNPELDGTILVTKNETKYDMHRGKEPVYGQKNNDEVGNISSSSIEIVEKTFKLLSEGDTFIKLESNEDKILIVGNTGSGKSTLTQFIAGDNDKLISKEVEEDSGEYIIEDGNRISHSTLVSKTIFPELVVDNKTNAALYDCPGFSDTRSASYDIASTYFIKKIVDSATRIKIVLTVSYPSVKKGVDRQDFMTLIRHTTNFIRNITKYRDGIAIIVTKVDNEYKRKEGVLSLVPDDKVTSKIANFFLEFKQSLRDQYADRNVSSVNNGFYDNAMTLLDTLLMKEGDNYTRLGIFRRPDEGGPLSNISTLQQGKKSIEKIIHNCTNYVARNSSDFGFTISEKSRNSVYVLNNVINKRISNTFTIMFGELLKIYHYKETQINDLYELTEELDKAIDIITQTSVEISNMKNAEFLVNIVLKTLERLDATIKEDPIHEIIQLRKYQHFLQVVAHEKLDISKAEWAYEVQNIADEITGVRDWYIFLNDLYEELVRQEIPQVLNIPIVAEKLPTPNCNYYNVSIFFEEISSHKLYNIDKIKSLNVDETKLKALNEVLIATLRLGVKFAYPNENELVVSGAVIKLSETTVGNISHTIKNLKIFALHTVIIDTDITKVGKEFQLSILAPRWEITGKRKFVLDGSNCVQNGPDSARKGVCVGCGGQDGNAGAPGGNAGNFFGVGEVFINGHNLQISTKGGSGCKGQAGGDGMEGRDAEDITINYFDKDHDDLIASGVQAKRFFDFLSFKWAYTYTRIGDVGSSGGNGGVGGMGGYGGKGGENVIYPLHSITNVTFTKGDGPRGVGGKGGRGGSGGLNGKGIQATCKIQKTRIGLSLTSIPAWVCTRDKVLPSSGRGISGANGVANWNTKGLVQPSKITLQPKANILNEFKGFLLRNFQYSVTRHHVSEVVGKIDSNSDVNAIYNTLDFINELEVIEKVLSEAENDTEFLQFYKSLLNRIGMYSKKMGGNLNNENKKVLSYLHATVLSKICALERGSEQNLVVSINTFLELTLEEIKRVEVAMKTYSINMIRSDYKEIMEKGIEEGRNVIDGDILPEIHTLNEELDTNIETLFSEVTELQKKVVRERNDLIMLKKRLVSSLELRMNLGIIKILGQALSFFGKVGAAFGKLFGAMSTVTESLALDREGDNILITNIPEGVKELLEAAENIVIESKTKQIEVIVHQISHLSQKLNYTTIYTSDLVEQCIEIKEKLEETNKTDAFNSLDITEIQNNLKGLLIQKENYIENLELKLNPDVDTALGIIRNTTNALTVIETSVDVYMKLKDDQDKINLISKYIEQTRNKIDQLKTYEQQIYKVLVPMVTEVHDFINKVGSKLNSTSKISLAVTNWKVQSKLRDMKFQFKRFTKGFRVSENFIRCFDKIDDGMSTLIGVYNQIQSYTEQKQLADYIADIYSVTSLNMLVKDRIYQESLARLDKIITSNIMLSEYNRFVAAFKQWVFPFADHYLEEFNLPSSLEPKYSVENKVLRIRTQLEVLKKRLDEYNSSIIKGLDSKIHDEVFYSKHRSTNPFFVWRNDVNKNAISDLLSGKEITLKADILSGVRKNAVKFNLIEINLKCTNETMKSSFDSILNDYHVTLTHHGNSYYQCGDNFYVIRSEKQIIKYSFEKNENGVPLSRNRVYEKIKRGDSMLSPYAMWSFRLANVTTTDFSELVKFKDDIEIELVGNGQYVSKDAKVCDRNLQNYYEIDNSINDINSINYESNWDN